MMAKNLFKTFLKPDQSVAISLGTAGLVFGTYQFMLPSVTEIHGAEAHNPSVASSQKKAMWTAAAVVGGATLLTRDPNVFVAGGLMFLFLEWSARHANATDPKTGRMVPKTNNSAASALGDAYANSDEPQYDSPDYSQQFM
jgi:hypothetical protein